MYRPFVPASKIAAGSHRLNRIKNDARCPSIVRTGRRSVCAPTTVIRPLSSDYGLPGNVMVQRLASEKSITCAVRAGTG
jgi:hypothetical protein